MATFRLLVSFCFLITSDCLATAFAQSDSTSYQLKEVEIFGKPAEVYAVGSRVTTIDSSYLSTYASNSLAEALQARTPLYFKSYGVSGISTVSFRGTNASQTAVLWNGLNISSPTLGQTDFATLPLSGLGDITVQYGSAGATYGTGAIGGAVLLNSPTYKKQGFGMEVLQEAGSFGRYYSSGNAHYNKDKLQVGASAFYRSAQNDFRYRDLASFGAPERKQEHAEMQAFGFTQDIIWQFSPVTHVAFHSWYTSADRELQPAMGSAHHNARLQDENLRLMAELNHLGTWGETEVKVAYFKDLLLYADAFTKSVSTVKTYQLQAEQTYSKGRSWSIKGGMNLQQFSAENNGYATRQKEKRASVFALLRYDPIQSLQFSFNLRQAFVTGYNPLPTPTLGFNWNFYEASTNQLNFKGSASGSYRVPTLNDRFWAVAGKPDLKPEQGWSYESGLQHVFLSGNNLLLKSEATLFSMLIDNWIQWAPNTSGIWRPENLQKVRSQGVELNSNLITSIGAVKLTAGAGYSYTSSEQVESTFAETEIGKQLMYVPLHKGILSLDAGYHDWSLLGSLNYTGVRYTSNSETSYLDDFLLLNFALNKKVLFKKTALTLSIRSDNISGTEYQTMAYRAMPLRNYTFSIRFHIL